jgi:salicylate hydroxylase
MRVAVIGGGLGGLAAAAFLARAGLEDVQVYEQAAELGEIGAGIQVPPNAVRLLHRLGITDQLDDAGVRLETGWELRRWRNGRILYAQQFGTVAEERFGAPYYVAHRARLLEAIRGVLPDGILQLGRRCVGVEQADGEVQVTFEDGDTITADVVVGADGIHSIVRGVVTTPSPPTFSGTAAYRCLIPAEQVQPMALEPGFKVWLGPGRHLVHYPVSGGREVNVVAIVPAGEWRTESWIAEGTVEGLLGEFDGWAPDVRALLELAPRAWLYALYDREPLRRLVHGRIALLGDAAHPMLPFLAQGAAQSFEDGAALALCLREAGAARVELGLERYQRARLDRVSEVQRQSRGRPDLYHLPDGPDQARRDEELAGQDRLEHQSWLYEHDAEAALRGSDVASPLH